MELHEIHLVLLVEPVVGDDPVKTAAKGKKAIERMVGVKSARVQVARVHVPKKEKA
jgi:hypothetical protein